MTATAAQQLELTPTDIRLRLIENGYLPIPVNGKRPRISGWSKIVANPASVSAWERGYADHLNTGMLCGNVVAIDVDVTDEAVATRLADLVRGLPDGERAPCRVGRAPKALYIFRATEPREKASTPVYIVDGHKCQIEVLGRGQQFVAFGIHPDTAKPYEWIGASPLDLKFEELPLIEPDDLDRLLDAAEGMLAVTGELERPKSKKREHVTSGESFWQRVNSAALADTDRWVCDLFSSAKKEAGTGAWRVSSATLGRNLEEDISIHPDGVRDFGEKPSTPIQLVIDYGGAPTPKDAAFWLCERLGLNPADLGWGIAPVRLSLNSSRPVPEAANDDAKEAQPPARILPSLPTMHTDPFSPDAAGGLLRDISKWITETAIIPVPELSLTSAIALLGGMFGDRALGPTRSGLNMFLTTVMGVASGKGHAPKSIIQLATTAGKPGAVTNGDPTSYAAIERMLRRNSSTVVIMDEFGVTLQDVNSKRANSAAASIRKFLLSIYDQADSYFHGRQYASDETKKDDSPIKGPALTVLGMTTPGTLYAGLSEDSLNDGFLSRFVFIEGHGPNVITPPGLDRDAKLPRGLKGDLERALQGFPKGGNPLGINKYTVPFDGGQGGDAYQLWADVFRWQNDKVWTEREHHINGRAAENTVRLATIRAVSRNPTAPVVNVEDVSWGWAIVHRSISIVTEGVDRHMAGSTTEALRKAIVRALEVAKDMTLPWSFLLQREGVSAAKQDDVADALTWLIETGKVLDLSGRAKPGARASFKLVAS
jgi:hypothetical protein